MKQEWYFVSKIILTYCEKNCSSDQEKLLKFKAEGQEFAKCLRGQGQFTQTVKGQNIFLKKNSFLTCSWIFRRSNTLEEYSEWKK